MKSEFVEYTIYSGKDSEIDIKTVNESISNESIKKGGLRWEFLENKWLFKKKFLWQSGLISEVLKNKYDSYIFLGSPYHISTWLAASIVRLQRKKVYYWMHGVYTDKLGFVDYIKLFIFYKMANGFFLYGNRSKIILNRYKIKSPDNIHVIYNSLDYTNSLKYRKNFEIEDIYKYRQKYFNEVKVPVIVFIGRLNHVKRIDMLIEAQGILKNKYNRDFFNLLVIGDGTERDKLIAISKGIGLEHHVCFLGAIYDEKINSYCLMNADLCVTPGEVGLTAIHSLSYGTPVISHDNLNVQMPEIEAVVPGSTGDLYGYDDLQSLTETIEKWLLSNPSKNETVMQRCFDVVDSHYNPNYQASVFNSVLK
jgi:glycosyltransferase involved in cell wall biosynthesis